MKKTTVLAFILILSSNQLFSQTEDARFSFFISANPLISYSSIEYLRDTYNDDFTTYKKNNIGYNIALGLDYKLNNYISFQTGIEYSQRSIYSETKYDSTEAADYNHAELYKVTSEYQFISFPISCKLTYFRTKRFSPYIKYGIKINTFYDYTSYVKEIYPDDHIIDVESSNYMPDLKNFNLSMNGGLGFDYNVFKNIIIGLEFNYNHLFNIENENSDKSTKMNDFGLIILLGIKI